jgi:hypothetical protein
VADLTVNPEAICHDGGRNERENCQRWLNSSPEDLQPHTAEDDQRKWQHHSFGADILAKQDETNTAER